MTKNKSITLTLKLDELNRDRAQHFMSIYDFETIIGDSEKKFYLGTKKPRICRFCKKTDTEVPFKSDAHVMPQFMGNRNLLSYFECDECNTLFSSYEDSFANFFGISRTFAQIKGQTNKVPKFKDPKTGLEVFLGDTGIQMSIIEGKDHIKIDPENKSLEITTERPTYVPIHIPKILIKVGLSMLPETDTMDYDFARRFIMQSDKDVRFKDSNILRILGYFIPGPPKFPRPFAQLFNKKSIKSELLCPSRQLILYYANYCFQIILPFADSDRWLQGKQIDNPIFPLLIDNSHFDTFGTYHKLNLNLTSNEKKKAEEHKLTFSFDRFIKTL
jgi:hypothetical protein